jgi:hypothetical protein
VKRAVERAVAADADIDSDSDSDDDDDGGERVEEDANGMVVEERMMCERWHRCGRRMEQPPNEVDAFCLELGYTQKEVFDHDDFCAS